MDWQVKCAKCNLFFPITDVYRHDNGYYCRECYKSVKDLPLRPRADVKCKTCGKALSPEETMVKDGITYCPMCYYRGLYPYMRDELLQEMTRLKIGPFEETHCESCGKVLTRFDDKAFDGGKYYCKPCYKKSTVIPHYGLVDKSGFHPRRGVTSLRNDAMLFECSNCGMINTLDLLKEDQDGKISCPKCKAVLPLRVRMGEKTKLIKQEDYGPTAQLFKCLGDPCRVKVIELLSQNELYVFELVEMTGFQYSAISYHLKMLKGLGLVQSAEKGNFMAYSLTEKGSTIHEFIERSKGLA